MSCSLWICWIISNCDFPMPKQPSQNLVQPMSASKQQLTDFVERSCVICSSFFFHLKTKIYSIHIQFLRLRVGCISMRMQQRDNSVFCWIDSGLDKDAANISGIWKKRTYLENRRIVKLCVFLYLFSLLKCFPDQIEQNEWEMITTKKKTSEKTLIFFVCIRFFFVFF